MSKALVVSLSLSALAVGALFVWSPGSPQGLLSSAVRNGCTIDSLYACTESQLEEFESEYTALEQDESNLTRQMEINRDELAKLQALLSSSDLCLADTHRNREIDIMLEQITAMENAEQAANAAYLALSVYEASPENSVNDQGRTLTIEALRKEISASVSVPTGAKTKNADTKKIAANNKKIDANNKKITANTKKIDTNNKRITANNTKKITTENKIATNKTKIATNNTAIAKFENDIDVAKKQKNTRSVTQLNARISNLIKQNTTFTNQNNAFTNQNTATTNQNTAFSSQNTTLTDQNTALIDENTTLKNQNTAHTNTTNQTTQDSSPAHLNALQGHLLRLTSTPAYIRLSTDAASKKEEFRTIVGSEGRSLTDLRASVKTLKDACEAEIFSSLGIESRASANDKLTAGKNKEKVLQEKDRNRGNYRGTLESIKNFLNELRNNRQAREQEDMLERERQQQDTIICEGGKVETRDYNGKVVGCICPFHCQEENNGQCGNWVGKTLGEAARDVFLDNIPFLGGNHDTKSISVDTNPDTGGLGEIATGRESEFGRVWENCV